MKAYSESASALKSYRLEKADLTQNNNQFNATSNDNMLARNLSAAGILSSLGGQMSEQDRANIATQLAAGQDQRSIQGDQSMAQLQLLQYLQQFLPNANNTLGRDATSTTNTTSNETTKGKQTTVEAHAEASKSFGG